MNPNSIRNDRLRAVERQVSRLERRIAPLQVLSNRISWLRVGVFLGGLVAGFWIGTQVNEWVGWLILLAALLIFVIIVLYHRNLEHWIQTFTIWRAIKIDQLARMALDWDRLEPGSLREPGRGPLALDLDLTGPRSLHRLLDVTISRQGSDLLADWLTQSHPELSETKARQSLVRELVPLTLFRDRFRLTFRLVMEEQLEGENLVHWLSVPFPSRRLRWALPVATFFVAFEWILFALNLLAAWPAYWLVPLLGYAAFYLLNQSPLEQVFRTLTRLDAELDRFSAILYYLENSSYRNRPHLANLCAPFRDRHKSPSAQIRRIKWVTTGVGLRSNPVLGLVLNVILPWDFFFAFLADHYRAEVAESFPLWAQVCYKLDALLALANFAYLNPPYAFPDLAADPRPVLAAQAVGHPLIPFERQVHNDFVIQEPGHLAIITGSNMAGKSTFLKTVGINLCLAYAGAPVDATAFRSAPFRLHTCVRITDSVVDGFSYFYAEVKCLKRLLEELNRPGGAPLLYLIDEIFRGTNNRERLLGSRAYIKALLEKNGVGLLATHDLELAGLAENRPRVQNYHFRDQVGDGRLIFDYKIRPGPSPTTNALKIMQMEGLPVESDATNS